MKVLVVEDSVALAEVVAEGLRDQGMAVDVAYDGLQAASKLAVSAYDVVVLDRDLPGVHGDAICKMIVGSNASPMVLMLTASCSPGERVSGLSLGARLLVKTVPFP
jgi:DNA-binding response OmpR family regulator